MRILVTGAAGFIGSELSLKLLERGETVIGVDNHNDYYDPALKEARLTRYLHNKNYLHKRLDISDREITEALFAEYKPQRVVNLAAQAGVRYSIENPHAYIQSNIFGFMNILEGCRHHDVEHLVYASSSSVYGANTSMPFSVNDNVDHPLSVYAATKKSNELMAHTYSHLYGLPTTGLRFFTVYGPWGRPDMALCKFTDAILNDQELQIFNFGNHRRDFTYIDDIVNGVIKVIDAPAQSNSDWTGKFPDPGTSQSPWRIYNIGSGMSLDLMDIIHELERIIGKKGRYEFLPMQQGDVSETHSDVTALAKDFDFQPTTPYNLGLEKMVGWYKRYYLGSK